MNPILYCQSSVIICRQFTLIIHCQSIYLCLLSVDCLYCHHPFSIFCHSPLSIYCLYCHFTVSPVIFLSVYCCHVLSNLLSSSTVNLLSSSVISLLSVYCHHLFSIFYHPLLSIYCLCCQFTVSLYIYCFYCYLQLPIPSLCCQPTVIICCQSTVSIYCQSTAILHCQCYSFYLFSLTSQQM